MTHPDRLVVKVGGSLYDHPRLKPGLKAWRATRPETRVLLVPGGGDFAEAVRRLDTVHGLGDEVAHWLALRSLELAAVFLENLIDPLGQAAYPDDWRDYAATMSVMSCPTHFLRIEYFARHPQRLPKSWEFTTDSLAACAAHDAGCELVLLKSIDIPPAMAWEDAAARGYVDAYFPTLVARHDLRVTAVNFRAVLDGSAAAGFNPSGPSP